MDGILRIGPPPSLSDGGTSVEPYNKLVKGYIEICSHPTVVAGLCAVCGKTVIHAKLSDSETGAAATAEFGRNNGDDKDGVLAYSSSPDGAGVAAGTQAAMSRMTVSGGYTVSVSREEGERIAREDARRLRKIRKLSLVLDLDHTLVHATWDGRAHQHVNRHPDVRSLVLPVPILEGDVKREVRMHHYVKIRPHVKEFLSECQERYEIGVYTAGTREYAEQVTLILARHLVGATLDQVDLEIIRQKLSDVEQEMVRKKVPPNLKGEGREEPGVTSGEAATTSTEDPTVSANKSVESNAGEAQPTMFRPGKRKRVAFGEPPVDQRTDEVTGQQLESLRRELEEAEDLERRAVEAKQRLFGSRVVSRTDVGDLGRDVKSLRRIFPCGGTMAAVVDDREDVWANAQDQAATANRKRPGEPPDNLLLVRPYHWDTFLGFADVNNASGVDLSADPQNKAKNPRSLLSAPQRASSENDQQLLWTTDVLRRLHQRYYAEISDNGTSAADDKNNDDASRPSSVPEILSEMRREVLRGCRIVLSGVIPIHRQNHSEADRPRPTMERYVEELGGRVLPAVTREVTHVVAAKDGTDKIVAARRVPGCLVVKTSWLMECVWSLTRRDELPHLLGPAPRRPTETAGANTLAPPTGAAAAAPVLRPLVDSKKENSSASSEDDDDEDDELAAELESEFL
jgi:RNA polymerase II subunit A-like phosphatase